MRNAGGPPEDDVKAVMACALTSNGIHHFLEQLQGRSCDSGSVGTQEPCHNTWIGGTQVSALVHVAILLM